MNSNRPKNPVVLALWANAILLAGILGVLLARGGGPSFMSAAMAQNQPQIAGGAGVYVMPGQLSRDMWGAYLLDVDRQTLVAYEYQPGIHQLKFVAARTYKYDRDLQNMSTSPPPEEIRRLVEKEKVMRKQLEENAIQAPENKPNQEPVKDANQ
jgi:hypothetical protein